MQNTTANYPVPTLIVLERHGKWASRLQRRLKQFDIVQTRSWQDHQQSLGNNLYSISILDYSAQNPNQTIQQVRWIHDDYPKSRSIVVASQDVTPFAWLFRELGAIAVVSTLFELEGVESVIRRHFASTPAPEIPFEEQIRKRLPWRMLNAKILWSHDP